MVGKEIEVPETSPKTPLVKINDIRFPYYDVHINTRQIVAVGSPSVEQYADPKHPDVSFLVPTLETVEMPTGAKLKAYRFMLMTANKEIYEYVTPFIQDMVPLIEAMGAVKYDLASLPSAPLPDTMIKDGAATTLLIPGFLLLVRPLVKDVYWTMVRADTVVSIRISKDMKQLYDGKKKVKGYEVVISTDDDRQYSFYLISADEVEWYIKHAKTAIAMAYSSNTGMLAV